MIFDSDRKYDEGYTPEEAIKILTEAQMFDRIKNCIKNNGLERTEDMIKEAYNKAPKLKEKLLLTLFEIWKG